jgi:spore coat polysaccharide biosynthesis protein SpsF
MNSQTIAVLQARMSSSRLPGKVMKEINGSPMIYWQIQRILKSKKLDSLVVVTSSDPSDDVLVEFLESHSIEFLRGPLDDVLARFTQVARNYEYDAIVRLTGDCPLVMPDLIDVMVDKFYEIDVDYLSNTIEPTFPDGLDVEIVKKGVLEHLCTLDLVRKEIEHVTFGVYSRPERFKLYNFINTSNLSAERWTVDYADDLDFVRTIFKEFMGRETEFTLKDVREYLSSVPEIRLKNSSFIRNENM